MKNAVGAIIEHPEFGFLIQLRDETVQRYPLHWSLFGGGVEEGEDFEEALYRELEEELLLKKEMIKEARDLKIYSYRDIVQKVYHVKIDLHPSELVLNEGKDMMFVQDLSEVLDRIPFAFNIRQVLHEFHTTRNVID